MSDMIEARFFRDPETGRPVRVHLEVEPYQEDYDPRKQHDTFARLLTWDGNYLSPDSTRGLADLDIIGDAIQRWADGSTGYGGQVDAHLIARYAAIFAADEILYVGGLCRAGRDGALSLYDHPEVGRRYVGIAVVTRQGWQRAMGDGYDGPFTPAELAMEEVTEYSRWATGEVYCYSATEANDESADIDDGTVTDTCGGLIGRERAAAVAAMSVLGERTQNGGRGWQEGYELTEVEFEDAVVRWHRQHGRVPTGTGWPRG